MRIPPQQPRQIPPGSARFCLNSFASPGITTAPRSTWEFWPKGGQEAEMGAVLYFSALHAEKTRHEMFQKQEFPKQPAPAIPLPEIERQTIHIIARCRSRNWRAAGILRRRRLSVDPVPAHRLGQHDRPPQVCATPFGLPAFVLTGPDFQGTDIGQVIMPAIYPFSWKSDDQSLWLGRCHRLGRGRRRQRIPGRPENVHRGWRGSAAAGDPVAGVRFRCHCVTTS